MLDVRIWWPLSLALACASALLGRGMGVPRYPGSGRALRGASMQGAMQATVQATVQATLQAVMQAALRVAGVVALPLGLACTCVVLSAWLTEQSLNVWMGAVAEYSPVIQVLLSLQALGVVLHGRVCGRWLVLAAAVLNAQLWLYHQALGVDFTLLGLSHAAMLVMLLTALMLAIGRLPWHARTAGARMLAWTQLALLCAASLGAAPGRAPGAAGPIDGGPLGMVLAAAASMIALGYFWQSVLQPAWRSSLQSGWRSTLQSTWRSARRRSAARILLRRAHRA